MHNLSKYSNTKYRVASICIMLFVGTILCAPVYSQEADSSRGIRVVAPLDIAYQFSLENLGLGPFDVEGVNGVLTRLEIGAAIGVMFPIGDSISIGPELGIRVPLIPLFFGAAIIHVPLRAVVHLAFTDTIGLDTYMAGKLNIWDAPVSGHTNITFDVGARLDLAGFLIGVEYAMPFTIALGASRGIAFNNFWQNAVSISLGYKISSGDL